MTGNIDLTQALADAQDRRKVAEVERLDAERSELNAQAGDLLFETQQMINSTDIEHPIKVARLQAARGGVNGGDVPVGEPAPASAVTVPFDFDSLSDKQKQIITMVVDDASRFVVEPSGAVKDRQYTKLRKGFEAEQAKDDETGDEPAAKSAAPAAKKAAAKAEAKYTKAVASPEKTKADAPSSTGSKGFLGTALDRGKKAFQNAQQ